MNNKAFKTDKTIGNRFVLLCLFFFAYASLASDTLNAVALYVAIPVAFGICFFQSRCLFTNKYYLYLVILFVWEIFSSIWSFDIKLTINELHRMLGVILLCYIISIQTRHTSNVIGLYCVYFFLYINAWIYASSHDLIVVDFSGIERLNDLKLNANILAVYTTYSTFAAFIIAEITKSKIWETVFRIVFFLMIPLSFFVALTTASRQVLVIQIPLIFLLLWRRYFVNGVKYKSLYLILFFLISIILFSTIKEVYDNSFLALRSESKVSDDVRMTLLKDAINVGVEKFPLGVGAGNFIMFSKTKNFSHNSFAELFANTGMIGLLIYATLLIKFLKQQWKRFRQTKDNMFIYFFIFGIIFSAFQVFYVFYIDIWLMSFFILVAIHSDSYYKTYLIR